MMSNIESSSARSGSDMSSVSSESEEDDTVNFIDTSNEDDSNSEVEQKGLILAEEVQLTDH